VAGVVWINGRIASADEPLLRVSDRGFQLGDGVFETLRARRAVSIELDEHLQRLRESAAATELPVRLSDAEFAAAIGDLLETAGLAARDDPPGDASVRITLSRGPVEGRNTPASLAPDPTLVIQASPFAPPPDRVLEHGLRVVVSSIHHDPASPLAGVKSTSRADSIFARLEAARAGADDALYPTPAGTISEGTTANLFIIAGTRIATPPLSEGVLAGTMRTWLLAHARDLGLEAVERLLTPATILEADEALFTSSVSGAQPVVALDGQPIGSGRPGPTWRRIREARERWIDEVSRGAATTAAGR
jgi:branched-subunit amino acid aminotransferase/4-amino-4-deoxychorismate lyase